MVPNYENWHSANFKVLSQQFLLWGFAYVNILISGARTFKLGTKVPWGKQFYQVKNVGIQPTIKC